MCLHTWYLSVANTHTFKGWSLNARHYPLEDRSTLICLLSPGRELFVYARDGYGIWSWTVGRGINVIMDRWICVRPIWQRQKLILGLKYLWSPQWWKQSVVHSVTLYPSVELVPSVSHGRELAHGHKIFKNQIFVCQQSHKPGDITFLILTPSDGKSLHRKLLKPSFFLCFSLSFWSPANCAYRCTSMDTYGFSMLRTKSSPDHLTASESAFMVA